MSLDPGVSSPTAVPRPAATSDGELDPAGDGAGPRRVCIDVGNETLREALVHVAQRSGWEVRLARDPLACSVVDAPSALAGRQIARRTVLVVEPNPRGAHVGMQALAAGTVSAVVSSDRPNDLAEALRSVDDGWGVVPLDLLESASRMPDLTERQVAIVGAVISGQPTREIARGLYLSDASIKRELATLFRSFGAENRLALAALGSALGFRPRRLTP